MAFPLTVAALLLAILGLLAREYIVPCMVAVVVCLAVVVVLHFNSLGFA